MEYQRQKYTYNAENKHEVWSIGHTEYQKGKIYKIEFDDGSIYIGSTIKTPDNRMKQHLSDKKSIVYRNKDKNPKISLIIDCPCENKHKLESVEKKYINQYAQKCGTKILNKRGNDEIKDKPEIKYSFEIEKEDEMLKRTGKMVAIKNVEKNKILEIQYQDGDKKVFVSKKYTQIQFNDAMDFMMKQQKTLEKILISKQ